MHPERQTHIKQIRTNVVFYANFRDILHSIIMNQSNIYRLTSHIMFMALQLSKSNESKLYANLQNLLAALKVMVKVKRF